MRNTILFLVLVVALIAVLYRQPERFASPTPKPGDTSKDTIFVSIASYRDKACLATVKHLYKQAAHPERVFIGICEQNTADVAESCLRDGFKYYKNVRRMTIPNTEAKGPCYARYLCSTLYRGERWFMQIDSHTKFAKDWDVKAVRNALECPSPRACLSAYPHDMHANSAEEKSVPILCESSWNNDGLPTFTASIKSGAEVQKNPHFPVPFTSGGFLFAPGSIVADVPYDPNLHHLFTGEEILYSARLWTSGYDFFTPKENIVFHFYYRSGESRWHEDVSWHDEQKKSLSRARRILGLEEPAIRPGQDAYALGNKRSIEAYWAFAGLDPASKTSTSKAKFC